jgi:hypothetical protein
MPVVRAKASAKTTAIFFMIVSPIPGTLHLARTSKELRDRHHVLNLYRLGRGGFCNPSMGCERSK